MHVNVKLCWKTKVLLPYIFNLSKASFAFMNYYRSHPPVHHPVIRVEFKALFCLFFQLFPLAKFFAFYFQSRTVQKVFSLLKLRQSFDDSRKKNSYLEHHLMPVKVLNEYFIDENVS